MTNRYLCIHGHFYQPPRENPWIDAIEYQASATPYHDWNERVTRECYGPNTCARVHGDGGRIIKLLNNYEYMSFNFGPTLLFWLEKAHPWIYSHILAADRASQTRYEGHGNALAQVFNHIIMPLARRRDKSTQIRWGLADFQMRFGRKAEGMWLAETAVDMETLDLMAQEGVKFTILSPTQAQSVRPLSGEPGKYDWQDVSGGRIDATRPYRVWLDKKGLRFIDVFFYDGSLSRAVAYEKILASGEDFLTRINQSLGPNQYKPQLVSIATDGESYGHHFKFGDLALAWIFDHLEKTSHIKLTNYSLFLEHFPPKDEVLLFENSSWSCAHGIERWRADCGCSVSRTPGWNQAWRTPLRDGLDWLSNELCDIFEGQAGRLVKDPWKCRDEYIHVFADPTNQRRGNFLKRHAIHGLEKEEEIELFQLVESQRMSCYMFTSCGWFFDDISGLEATQVLKYACRAIELVRPWRKKGLEQGLMDFLCQAKSNDPAFGDGGRIYQTIVKPSRIGPSRVTAHCVLAALAGVSSPENCIFSEMVRPVLQRDLEIPGLHAILGASIVKNKTGRKFKRNYLALRRGMELTCMVGETDFSLDREKISDELRQVLTDEAQEKIDEVFSMYLPQARQYRFKDLIPDTQKCIIEGLARDVYRHIKDCIIEYNGLLKEFMLFVEKHENPVPEILEDILRLFISDRLAGSTVSSHEQKTLSWEDLNRNLKQAEHIGLNLNKPGLKKGAQDFIRHQMTRMVSSPDKIIVENMIEFLNMAEALHLELDLWECQNIFYDLYQKQKNEKPVGTEQSSPLKALGQRLGFLLEGE